MEELEGPFLNWGWERFEWMLQFKQKHEPVGLAFIGLFTDKPGQMPILWGGLDLQLFSGFPAGTLVGGLAQLGSEFSAAGAPESLVRGTASMEQEDPSLAVKAVKQRRDDMRHPHGIH